MKVSPLTFMPVRLMTERIKRNSESDSTYFPELLYLGELIVKITVAAFVASIDDDRERHRYRLLHRLIRSTSLGDWASTLSEIFRAPTIQHVTDYLSSTCRVYTERVGPATWQYEAVTDLITCVESLDGVETDLHSRSNRVQLVAWFTRFSQLRNKTRGHGATTPATSAELAPRLEHSIQLLIQHSPILAAPWAYLHRNMSGKYRVLSLGGDEASFSHLRTIAGEKESLQNGVYLWTGTPRRVELIESDLDTSDFFLANGGFNGKTYELHSLISDRRKEGDAKPYLAVPSDLPASETEGLGELEVIGSSFANVPPSPADYIKRPKLEEEVARSLLNDRYRIVTLRGKGGIGKTSLILSILNEIADGDRFDVIVWFSSRDIDLTLEGPRAVQPNVLAEEDIAKEYCRLVSPPEDEVEAGPRLAVRVMAKHLRSSPNGATLFVFDNFETVRSPADLFNWLDTNIYLPNKVLITSRLYEFKADYPIEVSGMEHDEASKLIAQTATQLGVDGLLDHAKRDQIIEDSDGHPYVIKIILGEIAKKGRFEKPINVIWHSDEILEALFERTYLNLRPLAEHVLLMLSGWRSLVPQLAVEAVMLSTQGAEFDTQDAIDELLRASLIERQPAADGSVFLSVPLSAALFGKGKLRVSRRRHLIENDIAFLRDFGVTSSTGVERGIGPRIMSFFKAISDRIRQGRASLFEMRPVLEFVARSHTSAWLLVADLETEFNSEEGLESAARCVRYFLESDPPESQSQSAWRRLISIYRELNDVIGACSAMLTSSKLLKPTLGEISEMANALNGDRHVRESLGLRERGALVRPLSQLFREHLREATATDLSRLAWLHLNAGESAKALEYAELGLVRDSDNEHCLGLYHRLRGGES